MTGGERIIGCLKRYELVMLAEEKADWLLKKKFKDHERYCNYCSKQVRQLSAIHRTMRPLFNLRSLDKRGWRVFAQRFLDI